MTDNNYINSIKRAFKILDLYKDGIKYLGITEISKALSINKSTVHRIVNTLQSEGILMQDERSQKYKLGFKILDIASVVKEQIDHKEIIIKDMQDLCDDIGETVLLSVYTDMCGVCLERIETNNAIKLTSNPGHITPLHCGATGKILLAYISDDDINKVLNNKLKKYTENTVIDKNVLLKQVNEIRKKGYVVSREEVDIGAIGIGAPVLDNEGKLIYGLSVAGPIKRIETYGVDNIVKKVINTAQKISKKVNLIK